MRLQKFNLSALAMSVLISGQSYAASLASYCYLKDDGTSKIEGEHIDKRLPIASVSKVATAFWSIDSKGGDYRFETTVNVTPVEKDLYNVHISGSRDPYFGKESLHFVISQLNKLGITKVNQFSFDEKFKFFWSPTAESVAIGHYNLQSPSPARVRSELLSHTTLRSGYKDTYAYAQALKIDMVEKANFTVQTVTYIDSSLFQPTGDTKSYSFRSAPLFSLLKEMNRNSNNNAANQIFEHIGGADQFNKFVHDRFKITDKDILFYNGSGDRFDLEDGGSVYNEANCSTMISIIKNLRDDLKKENRDLDSVMAVAGVDTNSTVSRIYNNSTTQKSLIAKTGTVSPDITLAGMASTQDGDVYFLYNMSTDGTTDDWSAARSKIRTHVMKLIKNFNGGKELSTTAVKFISFDNQSSLVDKDSTRKTLP